MTTEDLPEWHSFDEVDRDIGMDDAAAERYEEACVAAVRQYLPGRLSQIRAVRGDPEDVRLEGRRPDTELVVTYRPQTGAEQRLAVPLWREGQIGSSNPCLVAHPLDVGDIVTINLAEPR
jgi:hypothetical protein